MTSDAGDALVSQVASQIGTMSADEQAAVYGAGYAFGAETELAFPPDSSGWIATVLGDFRASRCSFCGHGLLEHTLSLSEQGPAVTCDADAVSRLAWDWHSGPKPRSPLLVVLGVALWIGLPLMTIGLAGWVMPLVSAIMYRKAAWAVGTAIWGGLTVLLVVLIETEAVATLAGFLALTVWFGSALYGGFQVKPWLSRVAQGRRD